MRPCLFLGLLTVATALAIGCASQLDEVGVGDDDGSGATSGAGAGGSGGGAGNTGGSGATGSGTGSAGSSGPGSGGAGSGGATSSSGTGGEPDCPADQHFCGGVCTGNTPQTGCLNSVTCTACTAPANGTSTCSAGGDCDFSCAASYMKSGAQCVCAVECCSNADCTGGATCNAGTCEDPPPTCDEGLCIAQCIVMGCPIGICVADACTCVCP